MEDKVHLSSFSTASSLLLSIQNYPWHRGSSTALREGVGGFSQARSQHIPSPEKLTAPSRKQPCSSVPSAYSYSRQYQCNTVTQTGLQLAASLRAGPGRTWLPDPHTAGHGSGTAQGMANAVPF